MFEREFQFRTGENQYTLNLSRDVEWADSPRRILIVLQTVPSVSLNKHALLVEHVRDTVVNCIHTAKKMARAVNPNVKDYSFCVVNFNNSKHLTLKGTAKVEAEVGFATRLRKLIKRVDPTHVFISGDQAAAHMLPLEANIAYKRGWVFDYKGRKYATTFDLDKCFYKDCSFADLLGYWCLHLSYLMLGKHPYSLKDMYFKPRYVDTVDKFDSLMRKLNALDKDRLLAVDTETANLSAHNNEIYTIQFCLSTDPTIGYVVPLRHPRTPLNEKELEYFYSTLGEFFSRRKNTPSLITFNGSFDLMVIRAAFKLPIIYNHLWEIRAGEHLLDESIDMLKHVGPPMGGLAAVLASYENDFYYTAAFSKADRATTGLVEPSNKDFLKYGACDVCSIMAIHGMQLKRARHQELNGHSYLTPFVRHMFHIMGATTHTISHLQTDGSYVDANYLKTLVEPKSPIQLEIKQLEKRLQSSKYAQEANAILLSQAGIKSGDLWGSGKAQWVLRMSRTRDKKELFFNVMKIKPVSQTKTGADAIDKAFIEAYAHQYEEVNILGEWSKRVKLVSTYGKGWLKKLDASGYLRASYSFFQVITGRLGSWAPNLQNIPAHGSLSKIIKAMFTTTPGHLLIRFDYSAHEVRMWAIAAVDQSLADSFLAGLHLRQRLIKAVDQTIVEEIRKELKTKGDIHIQNVYRFWKKWVNKEDPLRSAVKAVVFGVLYGLSARSLGKKIGPYAVAANELKALKRKLHDSPDDKAVKARVKELRTYLAGATEKQRIDEDTRYAQSIIDKMFTEFKKGGEWTNKMKNFAEHEHYAYSPFGRKRHLWAALTGIKQVVASSIRQGSNAPIQGYASESAIRSSRDVARAYYTALPHLAKALNYSTEPEALRKLWVEFSRVVHDALYHNVPYETLIPFLHVLQWHATFGLAAALGEEFNINFMVPPEIELEIGAQDTKSYKWDWTMPGLAKIIDQSVQDADQLKLLDRPIEDVMSAIYRPYMIKSVRQRLQKKWPLLNVPDLEENIVNMHKDYMNTLEDKTRYRKLMKVMHNAAQCN